VSGEKRQRVLVEMMPLIENLHVKLILVGDGPERENLERRADELSVGDRIIFTGLQSPATVAALMKQADVFTLPSYRFDNQPMVFLEAIASGLPIVYCDDNMTEGLTPDNALLTDGIEAEDFAATFNALLPDVKRMKRMSEASVHVSKQFDRRQLAKRLLDYYEAAIVSQAVLHDS
jgi:glycosyltransferase involved in cell wall biosynthesis